MDQNLLRKTWEQFAGRKLHTMCDPLYVSWLERKLAKAVEELSYSENPDSQFSFWWMARDVRPKEAA